MKTHYQVVKTVIGSLLIVEKEESLAEIRFPRPEGHPRPVGATQGGKVIDETVRQLREYFRGERREFDLPLAPEGSDFQQRVWQALRNIPYGTTVTYGELARRVGRPAAARAVGAANGRNPIPIVIPCHRVIGKDGTLTGFGGGLELKERLLELESPLFARAPE